MKILVYPHYGNPYLRLLYGPIKKAGHTVTYLSNISSRHTLNLALFVPRILLKRLQGYTIFHLHWPSEFAFGDGMWRRAPLNSVVYWYYLFCLHSIKVLGYKLVWTAHDALPHSRAFKDDVQARRSLIQLCDLVIAHSPETFQKLETLTGVQPKKTSMIPHGNYIGVYPEGMSRSAARKVLDIPESQFVYLYVGHIYPYKGVDTLIESYQKLNDDSMLLIAGTTHEREVHEELMAKIASPQVRWLDARVEETKFQLYFAAGDVVVLPFKSITTSGSTLLTLSFGKAPIVPRLGDLAQLPQGVAFVYDPEEKNALEHMMRYVREHPEELGEKNRCARLYAEQFNWPQIAERTITEMQTLLTRGGSTRVR